MYEPDHSAFIDFFIYKANMYKFGTRVVLSDKFIKEQAKLGKNIYKYAKYQYSVFDGFEIKNNFILDNTEAVKLDNMGKSIEAGTLYLEFSKYERSIDIIGNEIKDYIIEDFVEARKKEEVQLNSKNDFEDFRLIIGWIVVLFIMFGGLIFNGFIILWPIIGILFSIWRENIKWENVKKNDYKDF